MKTTKRIEDEVKVTAWEVDDEHIIIDDGNGYALLDAGEVDAWLDDESSSGWDDFCDTVSAICDTHNYSRRAFVEAVAKIDATEGDYWTDKLGVEPEYTAWVDEEYREVSVDCAAGGSFLANDAGVERVMAAPADEREAVALDLIEHGETFGEWHT